MNARKDKRDHFEEKFSKLLQIFLAKGQIRIRYNYSGFRPELAKNLRIRLDPDPQHWIKEQ
jgi:hypothetical protein